MSGIRWYNSEGNTSSHSIIKEHTTMTNTQAIEVFSRLFILAAAEPDTYDPFADFAILRELSPVYYDPLAYTWHLFSYADVAALLVNEATTKTAIRAFFQKDISPDSILFRYFDNILFTTDTEQHTRQHDIFKRILVPRFQGMYPRVERIARSVYDAALRVGNPVEIVSQFSTLIPINVICDWMSIGPEYYDQLRSWTEAANAILDPGRTQEQLQRATLAMTGFFAFFTEQLEDRRSRGGADLLTVLAQEMDGDELLSNCVTLLIAAHESVSNTISQGIVELSLRPELLADLREHPAYLNDLADAFLRKNAATTVAYRQLTQPFACATGVEIPEGSVVALWLASANRDPEVFENPDELQLASPSNRRHLAFSPHSPHECIGAPLARIEVRAAFAILMRRTRGAFLLCSPVHMKPTTLFRGINSTLVRFTPVEE
jgi:cytochrome P450